MILDIVAGLDFVVCAIYTTNQFLAGIKLPSLIHCAQVWPGYTSLLVCLQNMAK